MPTTNNSNNTNISDDLMTRDVQWNLIIEKLLARYCDQAKCFEWMHNEAHSEYEKKSRSFIVFMTILNSFSGLSNIISGDQTISGFKLIWLFGSLSIFVSLFNLLQEKLGYATSSVEHKIYCSTWGTIRRKIDVELSVPRNSRKDCQSFMKMIQADINGVSNEGNTKIPQHIRNKCYNKFNSIPEFDIPDICGQIEHTIVCTDYDIDNTISRNLNINSSDSPYSV